MHCRRTPCDSVMNCLQTGDKWYWKGSATTPDLKLHPLHSNGAQTLAVPDAATEFCIRQRAKTELADTPCDSNKKGICVMTFGGAGIGSSIGNEEINQFVAIGRGYLNNHFSS